jgi:Transposase domain (DUF772)
VVLQSLYNLSDEQIEYLIRDRLSFMRFLDRGLTSAQALQPLAQLRQKSPKASIVRGSLPINSVICHQSRASLFPLNRERQLNQPSQRLRS